MVRRRRMGLEKSRISKSSRAEGQVGQRCRRPRAAPTSALATCKVCGDNIRPAEAGTCSRVWGIAHDSTQCA